MTVGKIIKTGAKYLAKKRGMSKKAQKSSGMGTSDSYRIASSKRSATTTGQQKEFNKSKRMLADLKEQRKSAVGDKKEALKEKIQILENKLKDMKKRTAVRKSGGQVGHPNRLY